MLQRLLIAPAQVKAGNNSQNVLNEIKQIIYSLYQPNEITKILKKHRENTDKPSIQIYVKKIENRITLKKKRI